MQFSNVGKSCFEEAGLETTQCINQDVPQDLQTMVYRKISTKGQLGSVCLKQVQTNKISYRRDNFYPLN